jgi:sigma-B regulation protein RsbU (phosphoserine phosphatase)
MESGELNELTGRIDKFLNVGIAFFDLKELRVEYKNELFTEWFESSIKSDNLLELISEVEIDKLKKRLAKGKEYKREREVKDGNRNRFLRIVFSNETDSIGLVKVLDVTHEKELEFMMDSYAKLAEKNKKELETANAKIQAQNERMVKELEIARQVQLGMLPFDFKPENDGIEFAAMLKPAKEVGGDFFDVFYIDSHHLCVCLGDVSDKGAGSALFMAAAKTLIKSHALHSASTSSIAYRINNELSKNNEKCMFSTLFIGILHIESGKMVYTNCGHCYPYIIEENMSSSLVKELNGPAIGVLGDIIYTEQELELNPGQTLFIYSDGVTEAINSTGEFYTDKRLKNQIRSCKNALNPETLIDEVFSSVMEFEQGKDQSDDITIVALKLLTNKNESL